MPDNLPLYVCKKTLRAAKITDLQAEPVDGVDPGDITKLVSPSQTVLITLEGQDEPVKQPAYWLRSNHPEIGDYFTLAEDGSASTMKPEAFEAAYRLE